MKSKIKSARKRLKYVILNKKRRFRHTEEFFAIIKIERCFSALREKHRQTSMRTKKGKKKIADKTRLLNNKA